MENQNTPMDNPQTPGNELIISKKSEEYLNETEQWTKFLSIVGFVFVGLIVIMALFASTIFSSVPFGPENKMGGVMGFLFSGIYLLMGALYFFPTWYLFKFSKSLKEAIRFKNNEELEVALSNHKSFYKFLGVFTVIMLAIYGIAFLIGILGIF